MKSFFYIMGFVFISCGFISCNDSGRNKQDQLKAESEIKVLPQERVRVIVGIADACQEPITFEDGSGLSADIMNELNKVQDKYFFSHNIFPARRFIDLAENNKIHIASFHNKDWGWKDLEYEVTSNFLSSSDIFITIKEPGITQEIFEFDNKVSKAGVRGFHYNFAGNEISVPELESKYSMTLVHSEKAVLEMVLLKRCKIGIVSKEIIQYLKSKSPEEWAELYISEKSDSDYDRYYMLLKSSPVNIDTFNRYLTIIRDSGKLEQLYKKYGLKLPVDQVK